MSGHASTPAGRSPHTLELYGQTLGDFERFISRLRLPWESPRGIRLYLAEMRRRGNRQSTIHTRSLVLSAFYRWLVDEEVIGSNPLKRLPRIKKPAIIPRALTDEQISLLINACKTNTFEGIRDGFLIKFGVATGVRRGELAGVGTVDIDLRAATVIVDGKGAKQRVIPFGLTLVPEIEHYLRYRAALDGSHSSLFITRKGSGLSYDGLAYVFGRVREAAGLKDSGVTLHSLRHTYAHRYLRSGGRLCDLQANLGHTTLAATENYLRSSAQDRRREAVRCDTLRGLAFPTRL